MLRSMSGGELAAKRANLGELKFVNNLDCWTSASCLRNPSKRVPLPIFSTLDCAHGGSLY